MVSTMANSLFILGLFWFGATLSMALSVGKTNKLLREILKELKGLKSGSATARESKTVHI